MEIKNRLFSYPVLCDDTDDYISSSFEVDYSVSEDAYNLTLTFNVDINCESIEKIIRTGQANCVIHIECSSTCFRKTLVFQSNQSSITIPKNRVNGELALLATIVLENSISNFDSSDLNEDYDNDIISLERGSILAYKNLPKLVITKNYEELSKSESIFSVVQKSNDNKDVFLPISFDISGEKIKIYVDENTYSAYVKYKSYPHIALSMLVLPALAFAIEELDANYDEYNKKSWLIHLEQFCKMQGKDFKEDYINSNKSIIEIAQELLNGPIGKAYNNLLDLEN